MPVAERMTAEEFIALPVPEHGRPWNLVGGEVVVNEPTPLHAHLQRNLLFALESWLRAGDGRGAVTLPLDVRLDEHNVLAPDILWYSEGRAPGPRDQPPSPLPDLAVEIRSPSTWRYDVGAKKAAYERHGLPELWLLDTAAEAVLVFRRSRPGASSFDVALELGVADVLTSPQLDAFTMAVGDLFPPH